MAQSKAQKEAKAVQDTAEAIQTPDVVEGAAPSPAPEAPTPKAKAAEKFNAIVAAGRSVDGNMPGTKLFLKDTQLTRLSALGFVEPLES